MSNYGIHPCPSCKTSLVERKKPRGALPRCETCLGVSIRGRLDRQNLKRKNGFDAHRDANGIRYGSTPVICFYCKNPFINTRRGAVLKYCDTCAPKHESELESRRGVRKQSDRQKKLANRARWARNLKRCGLSLDWLGAQEIQCGICKTQIPGKKGWCIDHDHTCCEKGCPKCVRGILCGLCNSGLGLFKDNIDNLQRAIEWVKRGGGNPPPLPEVTVCVPSGQKQEDPEPLPGCREHSLRGLLSPS